MKWVNIAMLKLIHIKLRKQIKLQNYKQNYLSETTVYHELYFNFKYFSFTTKLITLLCGCVFSDK